MGRTPGVDAPDPNLLVRDRMPLLDLEVSVVTPLFGGGATPAVADPLYPVRAASVRGHLRFWWRACKGAVYANAEELFQEEESIWGSTAYPSPVSITTAIEVEGTKVDARKYQVSSEHERFPTYALFPYQEIDGAAIEGVLFRLRIDIADVIPPRDGKPTKRPQEIKEAVDAALWAWLNFGGIGARTRRGCGSLYCEQYAPNASMPLTRWLRDHARQHIDGAVPRLGVPSLCGARLVYLDLNEAADAAKSWRAAVYAMRDFRQAPEGRNLGKGTVPGHSRWPEANSIRRQLDLHDSNIPREHGVERPYYPRADLGLPLIFQFKANSKRAEPPAKTYTVERDEEGAARMASPFILKPLAISPRRAVPLVLCLDAPHVWKHNGDDDNKGTLVLKAKPEHGSPHDVAHLTVEQLYDDALAPLIPPLSDFGATRARDALLAYTKKIWDERGFNSSRMTFGSREKKR